MLEMAYEDTVFNQQIFFDCSNKIQKYECKTCASFQTNFLSSLRQHVRDGHRNKNSKEKLRRRRRAPFKSKETGIMSNKQQTAYEVNLLKEQILFDCSNELETYQCSRCPSFQTDLSISLRLHIRDGHRNKNTREEEYKCLKCLFTTYSKSIMLQHSYSSKCATKNDDEREKRFMCYRNDYSKCKFRPKSSWRNPRKFCYSMSGNTQWFPCEHCQSKFKQIGNLKRHIIFRHTKAEDLQWFACDQCSFKFKQKENLKRHVTLVHCKPEDIQWFTCDHCPSKFKRKGDLKTHVTSRHTKSEDIEWFTCELCASKFKHRGNLKRHITYRHCKPEDIEWFTCERCSSKFKQKVILKRHVVLCHSRPEDVQWFTCDQCSCRYKNRGNLKTHVAVHHPKA